MDPISPSDRIVALLRQRLRSAETRPAGRKAAAAQGNKDRLHAVQALARSGDADERMLRRAFVLALLSDSFDPAVVDSPKFQTVVDQVVDALDDDPAGALLLKRAMQDVLAV
jgi:hypothetical protein